MAFVNLTLLFGGLLAAIPVVLHLIMRQQPKRQVFPALRFLKQQRESNRRVLQIRHWLLLLLRCAAIALLAAALARPSVDSAALGQWLLVALLAALALLSGLAAILAALQRRGRWLVAVLGGLSGLLLIALLALSVSTQSRASTLVLGNQRAPVAAVLVFDTSPRMEYRFQNKTRLEQAQEMAAWLITQLPVESDVAVVTARPGPAVFSVDLAAAKKAVERLQTTGVAQRLAGVLGGAVELAQVSDKTRKEIYVFTDLTAAAWQAEAGSGLAAALESAEDVALYVIDVGVQAPRNLSLGPVQLSSQSLVHNDELRVETEISSLGQSGTYSVELYLEEPDRQRPMIVDGELLLPAARRRERRQVELAEGQRQTVQLSVRGLPEGVHQGFVKIGGGDALAVDDTRYFTVEVKAAWPVLVVAGPEALTSFLTEAISPYEFRRAEQARFECTVVRQPDLPNQNLENYGAVCLLDPAPLTPTVWEDIARYVSGGGSLAVFLGHNALPTTSFNHPSAQRLLGGKLKRQWRTVQRDLFLAPQRYDHPMLAAFRQQSTSVPWHTSPVQRHWVLEDLAQNKNKNTAVVARYNNNKPALLDTLVGRGRVVTMTAPISDPRQPAGRTCWLELATSDWPYFVLLNEMILYLVDGGENKLNYVAGEPAVLANDPNLDPQRYQLFPPSQQLQDVLAGERDVTIKYTENPGAYRLKGHRGEPVVRGFAVNLAAHHSELPQLPREQLDQLLGQDRYRYARNRNEIELEVGQGRVGREFYAYLIAALALLLGLEHLLANRFYAANSSADSRMSSPGEAPATSGTVAT